MIFRCGMTDSARNASVRNGVAPVQPSPCAASLQARLCAIDLGERRIREQPGDGERALGEDAQFVHGDDPASDLDEPLDCEGHVPIGHADDDEVVRVVGDARRERAALQSRAGDEAEPDPARREVPLDDGDLREVALGARDRLAALDDGLALERLRDDLILDQADRTRVPPLHGIAKSAGEIGATRTDWRTQSGISTRGTSSIGRPRFSTVVGWKLTRSGRTRRSAT